jgi:hypothetical protein
MQFWDVFTCPCGKQVVINWGLEKPDQLSSEMQMVARDGIEQNNTRLNVPVRLTLQR